MEPDLPSFADRYFDALRAGVVIDAAAVIDDALAAGATPLQVQVSVIEPAMTKVGELWESGVLSIADEHLATGITERVLIRLLAAMEPVRRPTRDRILLAAPEGQAHVLGLRMVADLLEGSGFDVLHLGSSVPLSALARFAAKHKPDVTGLSYASPVDGATVAETIRVLHEACPGTRFMIGGAAVPPALREIGLPYVANATEVLATVEALLAEPAQPPSDALLSLLA